MKITITFDTLEEFQDYMGIQSPSKALQKAMEAAQTPQEQPKAAKPKKDTAPAQKATEPDPEPQATAGPQQAEVSKDFRVEVRKTLAQLNKKVGKNVASELIKGYGVEKLTEVSLADLPALMNEAKEALNAE